MAPKVIKLTLVLHNLTSTAQDELNHNH